MLSSLLALAVAHHKAVLFTCHMASFFLWITLWIDKLEEKAANVFECLCLSSDRAAQLSGFDWTQIVL